MTIIFHRGILSYVCSCTQLKVAVIKDQFNFVPKMCKLLNSSELRRDDKRERERERGIQQVNGSCFPSVEHFKISSADESQLSAASRPKTLFIDINFIKYLTQLE